MHRHQGAKTNELRNFGKFYINIESPYCNDLPEFLLKLTRGLKSEKIINVRRNFQWATLTKYTKDWVQVEAWIYPENIIEKFMPMSNSGGSWGNNGHLYCTGHDKPELYVMKLPKSGYTLEHVKTIPTTIMVKGLRLTGR